MNANGRSSAYQLKGGVLYTRKESRTSMPEPARAPKLQYKHVQREETAENAIKGCVTVLHIYFLNTADILYSIWTGMCVLAGCDFLPSISGIGTKRAYSLISKYKDINHVRMITLLLCYSESET